MMDKKTLMENMACEAYTRGVFNGLWLYAENGEIISKGAYGWRDEEDRLPIQEDSIFQLASITKQFTAAAVMLLVRKGLLSLDDDITKFFPQIPYKGAVIRQILSHTSGMPDDEDSQWLAGIWQEEKCIPSNSIVLRFLCDSQGSPVSPPGEMFEYSNPGYCLLAELVEKLSGVSFETFLKQNIFEPAGMTSTGVFHIRRDGVPSDQFVRNMVLENGRYILDEKSEHSSSEVIADDGMNGHDYVYTTIFDMLRWDRALREEKVLTFAEQKEMYTPCRLNSGELFYDDDEECSYGFGWEIFNDPKLGRIAAHDGGMPGLGTWYERGVDTDRVFVFANTRDFEDIRAYFSFAEGLISIVRDKEPEPITGIEDIMIKNPDKSKWESFCGKYEHPGDDEFIIDEVFMKDGELYASAAGEECTDMTFRLYPLSENTFGRKRGYLEVEFGNDCIMYMDCTCRKL